MLKRQKLMAVFDICSRRFGRTIVFFVSWRGKG
jgi:hypothetical protein